MATIIDGKKRIPFMRGMLMHYLIQRDFTHEEASEIANGVRDDLSKEKNIPKKGLLRLIDKRIRRNYGDRNLGDLVFWDRAPTIISVERKSGSLPFSKEILSHSVQASGLSTDGSYQIAQTIESQLIDQRRTRITHEELEDLTAAMLARHHSEAYAERYQVWRTLSDMDKPLIILIGGASGVGKTSLAINLASVLDIPRVVATDDIRQIMRLMLAPDLMPSIHDSSYAAQAPDIPGIDPNIAGFPRTGQGDRGWSARDHEPFHRRKRQRHYRRCPPAAGLHQRQFPFPIRLPGTPLPGPVRSLGLRRAFFKARGGGARPSHAPVPFPPR